MHSHRDVDLDGCIAGEKPAWDAFVRNTAGIVQSAVRRASLRKGGSPSDVDDRVQEVYVRLLQRDARLLRTFDPAKASLTTWLTIIARTVVHEHGKRRTLPITRADTSEICAGAAVPADPPELPWSALSEQQRLVLQLLFDAGLSVEQVAARLSVTVQTVRSAKHKALERLRAELAQFRGDAQRDGRLYGRGDSDAEVRSTNAS